MELVHSDVVFANDCGEVGDASFHERVDLRHSCWRTWPARSAGYRAVVSSENRVVSSASTESEKKHSEEGEVLRHVGSEQWRRVARGSRSGEPRSAAPKDVNLNERSSKHADTSVEFGSKRPETAINWREAWKFADGDSQNHWRMRRGERPPLSDDGARRVIKERESYERALRKSGVPAENMPRKWISRTPEQMKQYLSDNKWQWRWKRRYTRPVEAAIAAVRQTSSLPPEDVDMRQVMKPFVKDLGFRDMCIVLKEQRGWRQAREFFEWMKLQIPYSPSVIAYTTLLGIYGQAGGCMLEAYARWERYDTLLEFYEAMRQRGLVPSAHVYRTMIVTLYKAERHSDALMLWEDLLVEKLEPNFVLYAIIIHILNKEGRTEDAVHTFKDMRAAGHLPDELLYNTIICALGKLGRYQESEALYLDMKKQGIVPSKFTYTIMINVWSKAGRFASAAETLAEMQRSGCIADEVVYCSIINMYGKAGLYEEAEKIFKEMDTLGLLSHEKSYTSMAKVRAEAGRHAEALKLFDVMAEKGLLTTRMTWNTLLHCFVRIGDVEQATKVYNDMVEAGSANVVTYGNMINLYSKFQMVEDAENLLAEMRESGVKPDEYIYGSFVKLYCNSDMIDKATMVVQEMKDDGLVPDQIIKTNLMQAYGRVGRYDEAEELFWSLQDPGAVAVSSVLSIQESVCNEREMFPLGQALQSPIDTQILNQLLIKRAEAGELREAELLLDKLVEAGGCIVDTAAVLMINLYGRRGLFQKAKSLFNSLQKKDHPPSLYVYNTMIKLCAVCKELEEAIFVFDRMEENGRMFDAVTVSILVHAYTKEGRFKDAAGLMKRAKKVGVAMDTVAYNTSLKANLKSGNLKGALEVYGEMQEADIEPSAKTYTILISLFSKLGDLGRAVQAFEVLNSSEVGADEIAYSQMIHCYGCAGRPKEAADLFQEMETKGFKPNEVIYNNLLDAFARAGLFAEARLLLSDMRRKGCPPSSVTYLLLMSAYGSKGKPADAESLLHLMQDRGLYPDCRHYNEVIRAYGNVGKLSDACRIFYELKTVGIGLELGCFRTLVKIHLDHGQFEQGWQIYKDLSQSFTVDQNLYGIAVELCIGAGRRTEADQLKVELKGKGFSYRDKPPFPRPVPSIWKRSDHLAPVTDTGSLSN
uniref:PROP1-like PPR domain-containing protein n=1 Tax=Physcomitrium patens TaxID=3218 RepID=A0A7I4B812_PHYPA